MKRSLTSNWKLVSIVTALALLTVAALLGATCGPAGPQGPKGDTGAAGAAGAAGTTGAAGTSTGTLSGTVTNSASDSPIAAVTITESPAVASLSIETNASGQYTATLPVGVYTLTFTKSSFAEAAAEVSITAGQTTTKDVELTPNKPVVVNAGSDQSNDPAGTVALSVSVESMDGSSVSSYAWTQTAGPTATITGGTTAAPTITLASAADYKAALIAALSTIDRWMVQGINPHSLEAAETATFKVTVTTGSGAYTDMVNVAAHLPFAVISTGLQNVGKGLPVLLQGKDQATYDWALAVKPSGSAAVLNDATTRNPWFVPDVSGKYSLTVTDLVTGVQTMDVWAAVWAGAIGAQDADGNPVPTNCTGCHNGVVATAYAAFTEWPLSGHATIFSENVDTSTHYSESCFSCHTVGFNEDVDNGGVDDATGYEEMLASGLATHSAAGNWAQILAAYPDVAQLANIQCENCHGPNGVSGAHMTGVENRVSISSDVCATCHGEPNRHGRFQQWEESGHSNFQLAVDEGTSSSCARCHAGQGFLLWLPRLNAGNPGSLTTGSPPVSLVTWTADEVQPQTCATCHEPHELGTATAKANDVILRVDGDTAMLPAGFKAIGVGRGALCMTCHNTRNAAHNDAVTVTADDRAPHTAAQADVLMGQNAYFVDVGQRAAHSYIEDTCTTCHMDLTNPPAPHTATGTNHTFSASMDICANCHGSFEGDSLQAATHGEMEELKAAIEAAVKAEVQAILAEGRTIILVDVNEGTTDVTLNAVPDAVNDPAKVGAVVLGESHGRSAIDITYDGTTYTHVQLAKVTIGSGPAPTLVARAPNGQLIAKAAWNFFLIEGDGSAGVHNPGFTNAVIQATLAAL